VPVAILKIILIAIVKQIEIHIARFPNQQVAPEYRRAMVMPTTPTVGEKVGAAKKIPVNEAQITPAPASNLVLVRVSTGRVIAQL
jgi:hypothetical protein